MGRRAKILGGLNIDGLGLEIGPAHSPIASKKDYNIHVIDYLDQDGLIEKYKNFPVNTELIESVDFVWKGEPLNRLTPYYYDYIIASHVIEHVPDLITFLVGLESILRIDGVVSLAIPDKRNCFDFFKPITLTPEVMEAFERKDIRHPSSQIFKAYAYACKNSEGHITWPDLEQEFSFCHTLEEAVKTLDAYKNSSEYHDVHRWFFTPDSFCLLMLELHSLGLTRLAVRDISTTNGFEFFAKLIKVNSPLPDVEARRIQLIRRIFKNDLSI